MKITKRQLRRIIKEEKRKLIEQGEALIGESPSDLENDMAMAMQEVFEETVSSKTYQGTGLGWEQEISAAGFAYHQAIIDSGAAKMMLELFIAVEESLHNGEYA
jgi:hypothetical protein